VGDAVEALVRLIRSTEAIGQIVNIGGVEKTSINDLAIRVRSIADSPSQIVHIDPRVRYGDHFEENPRPAPSLAKLERLTGFRPLTPLDTVIREVVDSEGPRRLRHAAAF
jgi:UDP-glucose 4-epimerase